MKKTTDFDIHMKVRKADDGRLDWRCAKDKAFGVFGSDALEEYGFCRLTRAERDRIRAVNDGEAWFAEHSAGIQIRFESDSARLSVRVKLRGGFDMTNMTQIGQCGLDLYVYDEEMAAFVLHEATRFPFGASEYECALGHFENAKRKMRRYILYLPLYMAADEVYVGLEEGARARPFGFSSPGRIGVYGTSIAQGCSASRPGMAYTNILSRSLNEEVLNFGFSGVAFMEKEMGEILGRRRLDTLIADVEPNAGVDRRLAENAEAFLDAFFAGNPSAAVVLFSRILFALDRYDADRVRLHGFYNRFMKNLADKYRRKGYAAYFADGSKILKGNFTEFTADGVHPDDAGMIALARAYETKIKKIRKGSGVAATEKTKNRGKR